MRAYNTVIIHPGLWPVNSLFLLKGTFSLPLSCPHTPAAPPVPPMPALPDSIAPVRSHSVCTLDWLTPSFIWYTQLANSPFSLYTYSDGTGTRKRRDFPAQCNAGRIRPRFPSLATGTQELTTSGHARSGIPAGSEGVPYRCQEIHRMPSNRQVPLFPLLPCPLLDRNPASEPFPGRRLA